MKRLLVFLKDYKKEAILGPFFKLLEASFELIVPLVMAAIIDVGIAGGDKSYIIKMCGVLVLLAVVGLTSSITAQFFAAKAAVGFSTRVRYALFEHIQKLSFVEMDEIGTTTLINRMTSDVNQVQSGVNMVLRLFLRSPFIVFGAMIMAFTVDVKSALVFVVTIPLLSVVVFGILIISMPFYKKVQSGLDKVLGSTRENITGVRVIRAFNKQQDEVRDFEEKNSYLTSMQNMVGRISALTNPVTYIIINVSTLFLVWIAAKSVNNGYILKGDVVAQVNYMSQILVELIKLANLIINITKSLTCANRIADILDTEPEIVVEKTAASDTCADDIKYSNSSVVFSNVKLSYKGAKEEALSNIDFSVSKGETVGIIGGTGSGKTTLVNLIPRFYDVSEGAVYVDGKNVKGYEFSELRGKVGMVMQKAVLFSGTIEENLRWGNENATNEMLWEALETAQATDIVKGKDGGLSYKIEEGGKNLSGGQKQRLTIARALVKNPDILILDDSASALDFATDRKLREALKEIQGDKTIFIVSQRTSSIQFADKIIVLDDGNVAGIGNHEELLSNCEVYREIYDSQFKKEGNKHGK